MERLERLSSTFFDLDVMRRVLPDLLTEGLVNTVYLSATAFVLGLSAGLVFALMAISRRWWVRLPARAYVDLFRGLPAILIILIVGFGLPTAGIRPFGRYTPAYAILALAIISTAYVTEIFRAGIQSVEKGQMEAARSLGMTYLQAMWLVIVPQGVRRVLPPLTNEFIILTKDSSLVFVLGLSLGERELYRIGQQVASRTGNFSGVVLAGMFYLLITIPLTRLVNYMDTRMREGKPGAGEEEAVEVGATTAGGRVGPGAGGH
jgi:polar amino acid transport system permease protein